MKMELTRLDSLSSESDTPFKAFLTTDPQQTISENETSCVEYGLGTVNYTVGRGPLLQITDTKISRLVMIFVFKSNRICNKSVL